MKLTLKKNKNNVNTNSELKNFIEGVVLIYEGKKIDLKNLKCDFIVIRPFVLDNYLVNLINNVLKKNFKIVIGDGINNKTNRFLLEKTNIDYLLNPQQNNFVKRYDFIHHFNSGLNHVLCKIAFERDIGMLFSLNFLKSDNKLKVAQEIGRINQNIKLCRKYKLDLKIDFFYDINNKERNFNLLEKKNIVNNQTLISFHKMFSISNEQIKNSLMSLKERINKNIFKQSPNYIIKGIEVID